MLTTTEELRAKRLAAEIPASFLAAQSGINRSRLSNIERGYVKPRESELRLLAETLETLIRAKAAIQQTAASLGWGRTWK